MKLAQMVIAMALLVGGMNVAGCAVAGDSKPQPATQTIWPGKAPVDLQGKTETANATITVFQPVHPNGAAMIICPGGGFNMLMLGPEGTGIAEWLNQHGIAGIVLSYRLPKTRPFVPLLDAQRAIRFVRANARQWNLDPQRIGIIGFSAGGHLASTAETHFDAGDPKAVDPIQRFSCRPDFAILIYPVITMGDQTNLGTKNNLIGPKPSQEMIDLFSNEKQVTDATPPTFLAHAQDDKVVSPEHSQLFYDALLAHKIPAEYLKLATGGHGLNGYKGPSWDAWQAASLKFLAAQKFIPEADAAAAAPVK